MSGNEVRSKVTTGLNCITIDEIADIAYGYSICELSDDPAFIQRIRLGPTTVQKLVDQGHMIYGVTTGLGENCTVTISPALISELPSHVIQFHGCGSGAYFD